jgi:Domain of unknown function (DUF3303)
MGQRLEGEMRFLITWSMVGGSEVEQARILALFGAWTPPIELTEWSGFADGDGGMCIAETDDAERLAAVTAPWTPWLRFTVRPLLPIQQTAEVMSAAAGFWTTVG